MSGRRSACLCSLFSRNGFIHGRQCHSSSDSTQLGHQAWGAPSSWCLRRLFGDFTDGVSTRERKSQLIGSTKSEKTGTRRRSRRSEVAILQQASPVMGSTILNRLEIPVLELRHLLRHHSPMTTLLYLPHAQGTAYRARASPTPGLSVGSHKSFFPGLSSWAKARLTRALSSYRSRSCSHHMHQHRTC